MSNDYPTRIDLCDGKYTLIYDFQTGQSECLHYGEPWRQLVGDKMVLACFDKIVELQRLRDELVAALKKIAKPMCDDEHPNEYAARLRHTAIESLAKLGAGVTANAELRGRPLADGPA